MVRKPADRFVKPRSGLVVRATGDAVRARFVRSSPIHATGLCIYRPLQRAAQIGNIIGLAGSFAANDRLRRTVVGAYTALRTKLGNTEINRRIRHQW